MAATLHMVTVHPSGGRLLHKPTDVITGGFSLGGSAGGKCSPTTMILMLSTSSSGVLGPIRELARSWGWGEVILLLVLNVPVKNWIQECPSWLRG